MTCILFQIPYHMGSVVTPEPQSRHSCFSVTFVHVYELSSPPAQQCLVHTASLVSAGSTNKIMKNYNRGMKGVIKAILDW